MKFCPADLRAHYHEGRVIPFIGAGVSASVAWKDRVTGRPVRGPSWHELVNQAIHLLGFEDPALARVRGADLQILEYFRIKHADQTAKLTNWLSKLMDPPDDAIRDSIIHRELVKLDRCHRFYTTNYDDFLERAFRLASRPYKVVAVELQMAGTDSGCEIVKFHGDLDHPEQIVLTESDYEQRLRLSTALDQRLMADLLGRVLLFIGYSFRDPNVSYLFRLFADHFGDRPGGLRGQRAFIAVPDPSDFELKLFSARRIGVIPISGIQRETDIEALLTEMRS
jgi:hypothetical protein